MLDLVALVFATIALMLSVISYFRARENDGYLVQALLLLREIAKRVHIPQ